MSSSNLTYDHINQIPDDVWYSLFTTISLQSLLMLGCTNHKFYSLTNKAFSLIYVPESLPTESLLHKMNTIIPVTKLKLSSHPRITDTCLATLTSLTHLEIFRNRNIISISSK